MRKLKILVWILPIAIFFQSCYKLIGEGPIVNEVRTTPNFSGLRFELPGVLNYNVGSDFKVELQSQQNILNEVTTIMSGNDLVVRFKSPNTKLRSGEDIVINITAPALNKLELHGYGIIHALSDIDPDDLRLAVDGSGMISLQGIDTHSMDAEISGSGRIALTSGSAIHQHLRIDGSGDIDFGNLVAQHASSSIAGSGTMKLNVDQTLEVNIAGSGSVRYRGNAIVTSSISGSGSVTKW